MKYARALRLMRNVFWHQLMHLYNIQVSLGTVWKTTERCTVTKKIIVDPVSCFLFRKYFHSVMILAYLGFCYKTCKTISNMKQRYLRWRIVPHGISK